MSARSTRDTSHASTDTLTQNLRAVKLERVERRCAETPPWPNSVNSYGREIPSPLPLPLSIASRVDPADSGGFREAFGSHANSRPPSHSGGSGNPRLRSRRGRTALSRRVFARVGAVHGTAVHGRADGSKGGATVQRLGGAGRRCMQSRHAVCDVRAPGKVLEV